MSPMRLPRRDPLQVLQLIPLRLPLFPPQVPTRSPLQILPQTLPRFLLRFPWYLPHLSRIVPHRLRRSYLQLPLRLALQLPLQIPLQRPLRLPLRLPIRSLRQIPLQHHPLTLLPPPLPSVHLHSRSATQYPMRRQPPRRVQPPAQLHFQILERYPPQGLFLTQEVFQTPKQYQFRKQFPAPGWISNRQLSQPPLKQPPDES